MVFKDFNYNYNFIVYVNCYQIDTQAAHLDRLNTSSMKMAMN